MSTKHIRNFSIIAHIDHGKSTLADRIIETCGAVEKREMQAQILDSMDIERERGITIKANAIALSYTAKDGQQYRFHLIDTPGHVDFTYEVSRSLAGCEGAVLVVDATQGVEAQTLANVYLAMENNLEIIPILNKIDLPSADPERIRKQVEEVVGLDASDALGVSGKTGQGVPELLEQIVQKIPAPTGDIDAPLKVLLMDAAYDNYLGVVLLVRVIDGELKKGQKIRLMSNGQAYTVERTGISTPKRVTTDSLKPGEVGFMTAALKTVEDVTIGDTITLFNNPCAEALPGFKKVQPMVFCGLYPTEAEDFEKLKESLGKLRINDTSFTYMPEASAALGFGFRCGFLGLLHMEIIQERLEREFDLDLVTTAPGVVYKIRKTDGVEMTIENPADLPEMNFIDAMMEPIIKATILVPEKYVGDVMSLCIQKRGQQTGQGVTFIGGGRVMLTFKIPLNEVVLDFYDKLKSITSGYASFDYEHESFQESSLAKVNILINGELVDALSMIVHRESAERKGRALLKKLKELIPRQMFEVNLQAAIGAKVIASERLSAMRKDVTAKCYGGDITRKRKLLEKQKKGKKRMKSIGRVDIPQEAFLAALKMED